MRVCAVVVTFNRPILLKRCVEALIQQTKRVDRIIVVDNASQISGAEVLQGMGDQISHIQLDHNIGGGGGFHLGLREAFKLGYDAVWLMDDDGVPQSDALAALCEGMIVGDLGIANCLVVSEEDHAVLSFGISIDGQTLHSVANARKHADINGIVKGHFGAFNGTLISKDTYNYLGNIKFECFIWGDETEYVFRARRKRVSVGTVVSSLHYHPRARGVCVKIEPFAPVVICPSDRSKFLYRNIGYNYYRYLGPTAFIKNAISYVATFVITRKFSEIFIFIVYNIDGALNSYVLPPRRGLLANYMGIYTKK